MEAGAPADGHQVAAPTMAWSLMEPRGTARRTAQGLRAILAGELRIPEDQVEVDLPFAEMGLNSDSDLDPAAKTRTVRRPGTVGDDAVQPPTIASFADYPPSGCCPARRSGRGRRGSGGKRAGLPVRHRRVDVPGKGRIHGEPRRFRADRAPGAGAARRHRLTRSGTTSPTRPASPRASPGRNCAIASRWSPNSSPSSARRGAGRGARAGGLDYIVVGFLGRSAPDSSPSHLVPQPGPARRSGWPRDERQHTGGRPDHLRPSSTKSATTPMRSRPSAPKVIEVDALDFFSPASPVLQDVPKDRHTCSTPRVRRRPAGVSITHDNVTANLDRALPADYLETFDFPPRGDDRGVVGAVLPRHGHGGRHLHPALMAARPC